MNRRSKRVLLTSLMLAGLQIAWMAPESVTPGDLNGDGRVSVADLVLCARAVIGDAIANSSRADLNSDGRVNTTDLMLLVRRILSVDPEGTLYPGTGGTAVAADGAAVQFPPDFGTGKIAPTFSKIGPASGAVDGDLRVISGEYQLTVDGSVTPTSQLIVSLPIASDLLPGDWDETTLCPEYFDQASQSWKSVGSGINYESTRRLVSFDAPLSVLAGQLELLAEASQAPAQATATSQARFRVQRYLTSASRTAHRPGSAFELTYYPSSLNKNYSVKKDADWASKTGHAVDPEVPDYVEDLDYALNEVYQALLQLQSSAGPMFAPLTSLPREVLITHLGSGIKGNTSLGGSLINGSLKLSNDLADWDEMRLTAAHELVHVLQGQYYSFKGLITGQGGNRWFIEATADYLAARVNGLSDQQKSAFYGQTMTDYLSVPITANNSQSFYSVAHFLDWLSHRRCRPTLVGDALQGGGTVDLTNLGAAIQQNGGLGLTSEFLGYLDFVLRNPQDYGGFNLIIKSNLNAHSQTNHVPQRSGSLDNQRTFINIEKTVGPLSATYLSLVANNDTDALLVIDPSASDDYPFNSVVFGFLSSKNPDYQAAAPLDQNLTFQEMRLKPLTVKPVSRQAACRAIQHEIGYGDGVGNRILHVAYYLLLPPSPVVGTGKVSWAHRTGNIPEGYIQGYNVFKNGVRQNKNVIPFEGSGTGQEYLMPALQAGDQVGVQVVDKYGHVWPELAVPPAISTVKVNGVAVPDAGLTVDGEFSVQVQVNAPAPLTALSYTYAGRPAASILSGGAVQGTVDRTFAVTVSDLNDGDYTLTIDAKDANGQTASVTRRIKLERKPPPPVGKAYVSPPEGYQRAWVLVLSEGGFGATRGNSSVEFGGVPVPDKYYYSWSDNCISLWVPDGAPVGSVKVVVKVNQTTIDAGTFKVLSRIEALQQLETLEGRVEGRFIMSDGQERSSFSFANTGSSLQWSGSAFTWTKQWDESDSGVSHKGSSGITGSMNVVPFRPTLSVTWLIHDEGTRTVEVWTGSGYETKKVKFAEETRIVITDLPDAFENKDKIPLPFAESFLGGSSHVQVTYSYSQEDDGSGQNKKNVTLVTSQVTGVGCWFN